MTSDDRDPATKKAARVRELLADAVLTEVQMINAGMEYRLPETAVDTIARAVTSRIDHAFEVSWSPDWVAPGGPHTWNDRDGWRAMCNECLRESPAAPSEDEAVRWFDAHDTSEHPTPEHDPGRQ